MNWRWISMAALLAALVAIYGTLTNRGDDLAMTAAPPQPGFFLKDAVITQTQADGTPGIRLLAQRIEQRRIDDSFHMQGVRVDYTRSNQRPLLLTSDEGFMPDDPRILEFRGNVHLRPSEDTGTTYLRTDSLFIDTEHDIAYSNVSPTQVRVGQYLMTVKGFRFDLKTEKIKWQQVRGHIETDSLPDVHHTERGAH